MTQLTEIRAQYRETSLQISFGSIYRMMPCDMISLYVEDLSASFSMHIESKFAGKIEASTGTWNDSATCLSWYLCGVTDMINYYARFRLLLMDRSANCMEI